MQHSRQSKYISPPMVKGWQQGTHRWYLLRCSSRRSKALPSNGVLSPLLAATARTPLAGSPTITASCISCPLHIPDQHPTTMGARYVRGGIPAIAKGLRSLVRP